MPDTYQFGDPANPFDPAYLEPVKPPILLTHRGRLAPQPSPAVQSTTGLPPTLILIGIALMVIALFISILMTPETGRKTETRPELPLRPRRRLRGLDDLSTGG